MQVVTKQNDADEVAARFSYNGPYRFRLWLAAVEDSHALGMGFRAYFSHITRSLAGWARQGTRFVQEDGKELSIDVLTQDDLWGFLGKQDEQPRGPKRRINDLKVAVLDVYFKKQYPLLADTFTRSGVPVEMATILKLFFDGGLAHEPHADYIAPWSGLYVAHLNIDPVKVIHKARQGELRPFVITAIMIRPSEREDSRIVHKVVLPLLPEYLKVDSEGAKNLKKVEAILRHHRPAATTIHSGMALVSFGVESLDNIKLSCILRDRTTYKPATSDITIARFTDGLSETSRRVTYTLEFADGFLTRTYMHCGHEEKYATKRQESSIFSQQLFDELWRLYDTLGDEV